MTDEEKAALKKDEEMAKVVTDLQTKLTKADGEKTAAIKEIETNFKNVIDEQQKKYDDAKADLEKKIVDTAEEAKKRADELEKKYARTAHGGHGRGEGRTPEQKAQMDAFLTYAQKGEAVMMAQHDEKAYNIQIDPEGGYLQVPPVMSTDIIDQAVQEISPALQLAEVQRISGNENQMPAITAHAVASRVSETGTTTADTTLAFGKETMRVDPMTVLLQSSRSLIMDSAFNIESMFSGEVARATNLLLGTEWVSGDGVGRVEGFLSNASVLANVVASGSASTLTAGTETGLGLNGLYWNLKEKYMANAKWLMRRATMMVVYGLVDGQGQYLLRWGLNQLEGRPVWSIMGSPAIHCPDMPAIAGSAYPIAWGDFNAGTKIIISEQMSMIKDIYTNKATNIVDWMWYLRNGGGVKNPEAISVQQISAS
jgi:HK97 family phage major capsid protein